MRNKLYAGLMILALIVSLGTLFFALQPSAEAGDGKGPSQDSAPPPPPPGCVPMTIRYCTGPLGTSGCPSYKRPMTVITTDLRTCETVTSYTCAYPSQC